jgi:hypothetical protein
MSMRSGISLARGHHLTPNSSQSLQLASAETAARTNPDLHVTTAAAAGFRRRAH